MSAITTESPEKSARQLPLEIAESLAGEFAQTAVERDKSGGTPKEERDRLRASGLLTLLIPPEFGGLGVEWPEIFKIIRTFARVDSSIAHVFGFQQLMLATVELFGNEAQREWYFQRTVQERWFWGNALNPLDTSTGLTFKDGRRFVNGRKGFSSGSVDADALIVSAIDPASPQLVVAAVPLPRNGILVHADWDNMGQRQTDSGTVEFVNAELHESELLRTPGPLGSIRASLRPCIAQLIFANIFLGLAEGAFGEARNYTLAQTRAWPASGIDTPTEDPYILRHYGELFLSIQTTRLLVERAAESFNAAWEAGESISENLRGRAALDIAAAKAESTRTSLEVTNRIFEVMGSRATAGAARLDRFWRNARTQTLHDPVDYKIRELGEWALNRRIPKPSFYS